MNNINCPLCNSSSKKISDYLFNVDYDSNYLGKPNILNCKKCNLSFVDEQPEISKLDYYYTNIYRAEGRPHFIKSDSIIKPSARHYLTLINLIPRLLSNFQSSILKSKPIKILEIGAGWGETGKILNNIHPGKFEMLTIEPCLNTRASLEDASYSLIDSIDFIEDETLDAVISLHVLEHFANPYDFINLFESKLKRSGYLFLEVPNCRFSQGFERRPYDSPHLTFWNSESLRELASTLNYELISLYTSGDTIVENFKEMKAWREKYSNWNPTNHIKTKSTLKGYLKLILKKLFKKWGFTISRFNLENTLNREFCCYEEDDPNHWVISAFYKKN